MAMTSLQIINLIVAGGLLGVLGQGIRIAVGLKKMSDTNNTAALQENPPEPFNAGRLVISIFIGFVAGALGLFGNSETTVPDHYSRELIISIIAIGYSGADFIEGLLGTYIKKPATNNTANTNNSTDAPANADTEIPVG